MKQVGKFLRGSLLGMLLIAVVYSPFETKAEESQITAKEGVVTAAAVIEQVDPIFDSMAFVAQKAELSEILSPTPEATPTSEMKKEATATASLKRSRSATPSAVILAANIEVSTPTPISVQPVAQAGIPFDEFFTKYAAAFNVSKDLLVRIARCESGFREGAVNGPYLGMFQYLADTWSSTRNAMGENPDPSLRVNAEEAIKTTAWKIAHGGIGAWPVCGK